MEQYKQLCKEVLENGKFKSDRTGTGTISLFGAQKRYNLNIPYLVTHKSGGEFFKKYIVSMLKKLRHTI